MDRHDSKNAFKNIFNKFLQQCLHCDFNLPLPGFGESGPALAKASNAVPEFPPAATETNVVKCIVLAN